jgi:RNA polymerase sigma-32 factor
MPRRALHLNPTEGFGAYLDAIDRYPVLDRDDECRLARRASAGDKSAADLLACCSLRHVVAIAVRLRGYGLPLSELVAEGNLGLLEALPRFDPERGLRLMTYARHFVRARMLGFVMRQWSLVGFGSGALANRLFFSMPRERARLSAEHGESSEVDDVLALRFGVSAERVRHVHTRRCTRDRSLSQPRPGTGETWLEALPGREPDAEVVVAQAEERELITGRIRGAMSGLDMRERLIAQRRLLDADPATLTELGRQLGVSRERVRQLEARVRDKLQASLLELSPAAAAA